MSHHAPPSPDSSEALASSEATPATKFSAFSPDGARLSSGSTGRGIVRPRIPPPFDLQVASHTQYQNKSHADTNLSGGHDPFVVGSPLTSATTRSSSDPSKLSPAAAAFTPSSVLDSPVFTERQSLASGYAKFGKAGIKPLEQGQQASPNQASHPKLLPQESAPDSKSSCIPPGLGVFSSDSKVSRYILVRFAKGTTARTVEQHFKNERLPSLKQLVFTELASNGTVLIGFSDLREATHALRDLSANAAQYISSSEFNARCCPAPSAQLTIAQNFEGQVIVTASLMPRTTKMQEAAFRRSIVEILEQFGDVMAFKTMLAEPLRLVLRVEFFDVATAQKLVDEKGEIMLSMYLLAFEAYTPECKATKQTSSRHPGPIIMGQETPALSHAFNRISLNDKIGHEHPHMREAVGSSQVTHNTSYTTRKSSLGAHTPSPLVGSSHGDHGLVSQYIPSWGSSLGAYGMTSPIWSPFSPGTIGQERGSPRASHEVFGQHRGELRMHDRQPADFAGSGHNVVEVNRIRAGLDVRTTIMLRNIPNKIDQAMLKDIIDETSLGKYDFMYLRIDFANNCNVGYAFINFADPIWIVDFVNARAGHRWNRYNSDKVAEVSYATIQGRDCLIQKFRNSSVMLEHPSFRPKLFRTGAGPLVGTEEEFPGPDNPSKMRRSVENAEHVGLFAPRAGQNFRDEQRRHRSQFDRGTRLGDVSEVYERKEVSAYNQANVYRSIQGMSDLEPAYQGLGSSYYY